MSKILKENYSLGRILNTTQQISIVFLYLPKMVLVMLDPVNLNWTMRPKYCTYWMLVKTYRLIYHPDEKSHL